jgi:peroxiredoxin/outer membrane lipoprotein-sorting protein
VGTLRPYGAIKHYRFKPENPRRPTWQVYNQSEAGCQDRTPGHREMMTVRNVALVLALVLIPGVVFTAQPVGPDAMQILGTLEAKVRAAKTFAYEGELTVQNQRTSTSPRPPAMAGRRGGGPYPPRPLPKSKVELAIADAGKYMLRIHPENKGEYLLVSDGHKTWTYVPKLKQYSEDEGVVSVGDAPGEDEEESESDQERDPSESLSIRILRMLSAIHSSAEVAELRGESEVRFEGKKQRLTVVFMRSRKEATGDYADMELTLDPESLKIARLVWNTYSFARNTKYLVRNTAEFSRFQIGAELPESIFRFQPPAKAKLVDNVPIPGQTGATLVNRPVPDLELKTLEGDRVQLAALRGRPVLLNFWASWCGPCRTELPGLIRIYKDYKDSGLVVLGIDDEPAATARNFVRKTGMSFPTLEDPDRKAHKMFAVRAIPTIFLVDAQGKVVRFFRGTRDESALRTALRDAFHLPVTP